MMRYNSNSAMLCGCLLVMGIALAPTTVRAATNDVYGGTYANWPTTWTAIQSLNDPHDTGIIERCDFVGDANSPAVYVTKNDEYVFFRTRMHDDTIAFADAIWIFVDAVGSGPEYIPENAFVWDSDGKPTDHGLELQVSNPPIGATWSQTQMADVDGSVGQKYSPPDFALTGGEGYLRVISGMSTLNFSNTTVIDWAISFNVITGRTKLTLNQWRIQVGSRSNAGDHKEPIIDVAANHNPTDLGLSWSDSFAIPEASRLSWLPALMLLLHRRSR